MIRARPYLKLSSQNIKRNIYLLFFILFILETLFNIPSIYLKVTTLLCLLIALKDCSKIPRLLGITFLAIGSIMLGSLGKGFLYWMDGTQEMVSVICLLMVVHNLAIPLEVKKYKSAFDRSIQSLTSPKVLYMSIFTVAAILGGFVLFAIVPMLYFLVKDATMNLFENAGRSCSTAVKRGFCLTLAWSPLSVNMAVAMEYSGVPYIKVLPYTIIFVVIGALLSLIILLRMKVGRDKVEFITDEAHESFKWTDLLYHILYSVVLIVVVLCLNRTKLGPTKAIIFTSLLVPFIWCILFREAPLFKKKVSEYLSKDILYSMDDIFIIFISMGVLSFSTTKLGLTSIITPVLSGLNQTMGSQFLYMLFPLVIILFTIIGIHPIAAMALVMQNVNIAFLGISPVIYTATIIVGGALSNILAPFSATNYFLTKALRGNPLQVGIGWNIRYVSMLFLLYFVGLFLVNH